MLYTNEIVFRLLFTDKAERSLPDKPPMVVHTGQSHMFAARRHTLFATRRSMTSLGESAIMKNELQPIGLDRPAMQDETLASVPIEHSSECKASIYALPATRRADRTPAALPQAARIRTPILHRMKQLLIIAMLVAWTDALAAGERDVVKPLIGDKLISERLTHQEMMGGEIDRRIMDLIYRNYMVLNLDRDWLDKFRNRTDRGDTRNVYYGIGKVLDAGSLFAQYTGDPKVAQRTQYIMDQMRASRDPDGYVGFWRVEPNNYQNVVNWILHEQEYFNLALVRNYRTTGNPQSLADAKVMADYIMRSFPANGNGEHVIPPGTSIAGITEGFVELYRVSGDKRYLDFARNLQYEPHWYYLKPYDVWEKNISKAHYHVYVMLSHMYPDTELYRLIGGDDYLKKSLWMKQELLERGRGGLLVTGSTSEGEHFTYNQQGSGSIEESCVTAYFLRWIDSLMRLEGDMRYGDIMERTIYNALFGRSPRTVVIFATSRRLRGGGVFKAAIPSAATATSNARLPNCRRRCTTAPRTAVSR